MRFDDEDDDEEKTMEVQSPSRIVEENLFKRRHVVITGTISDKTARYATERLLALAAVGDDPINVFLSSPGGHVESGDMVHDIIQFIKPDVRVIGSGWVASAGALIFVSVAKDRRFCLPNTRFLLHQPSGGIGGSASDVEVQAEQIRIMKRRFDHIFAAATGQTPERIAKDTERDFWLSTEEAKNYGILGTVVSSFEELERLVKVH
jgi:ATP-dependent Clp protease protease subunit